MPRRVLNSLLGENVIAPGTQHRLRETADFFHSKNVSEHFRNCLYSLLWDQGPLKWYSLGLSMLYAFLGLGKQNQNVFLLVLVGKVMSFSQIKKQHSCNPGLSSCLSFPIHPTLHGQLFKITSSARTKGPVYLTVEQKSH